jgi:hypothetical protein
MKLYISVPSFIFYFFKLLSNKFHQKQLNIKLPVSAFDILFSFSCRIKTLCVFCLLSGLPCVMTFYIFYFVLVRASLHLDKIVWFSCKEGCRFYTTQCNFLFFIFLHLTGKKLISQSWNLPSFVVLCQNGRCVFSCH